MKRYLQSGHSTAQQYWNTELQWPLKLQPSLMTVISNGQENKEDLHWTSVMGVEIGVTPGPCSLFKLLIYIFKDVPASWRARNGGDALVTFGILCTASVFGVGQPSLVGLQAAVRKLCCLVCQNRLPSPLLAFCLFSFPVDGLQMTWQFVFWGLGFERHISWGGSSEGCGTNSSPKEDTLFPPLVLDQQQSCRRPFPPSLEKLSLLRRTFLQGAVWQTPLRFHQWGSRADPAPLCVQVQ